MQVLRFVIYCAASTLCFAAHAEVQSNYKIGIAIDAEATRGSEIIVVTRTIPDTYEEVFGNGDGRVDKSEFKTIGPTAKILSARGQFTSNIPLIEGTFTGSAVAEPIGLANFGALPSGFVEFINQSGASAVVSLKFRREGTVSSAIREGTEKASGSGYTVLNVWNNMTGQNVIDNRVVAEANENMLQDRANASFSDEIVFRLRPGQRVKYAIQMISFATASAGDVDTLFEEDGG